MAKLGVIGHVEWVRFALVDHLPAAGEIVEASDQFELAAGGGAVAAVQLSKLAGSASFFTALGSDAVAAAAAEELRGRGVDLRVATRPGPQRWAFTHISADGERTITVVGERLVPSGAEPLGWQLLDRLDAVYFTGGDALALAHARRARVLVLSARALDVAAEAAVPIDVVIGSGTDDAERWVPGSLPKEPRYVVRTNGRHGGTWDGREGLHGSWEPAKLPGDPIDAYGCGDSFAAGLTFAIGSGLGIDEALRFAARCGAAVLCGRGPYAGQLTADEL